MGASSLDIVNYLDSSYCVVGRKALNSFLFLRMTSGLATIWFIKVDWRLEMSLFRLSSCLLMFCRVEECSSNCLEKALFCSN